MKKEPASSCLDVACATPSGRTAEPSPEKDSGVNIRLGAGEVKP